MIPKSTTFHSKKLTQAANGTTCIKCNAPGAYACHFNGTYQHQYGKGRSVKCSDIATAEFCHRCDQQFSEGTTEGFTSQDDRDAQFLHWVTMTNIRRASTGVLKV